MAMMPVLGVVAVVLANILVLRHLALRVKMHRQERDAAVDALRRYADVIEHRAQEVATLMADYNAGLFDCERCPIRAEWKLTASDPSLAELTDATLTRLAALKKRRNDLTVVTAGDSGKGMTP